MLLPAPTSQNSANASTNINYTITPPQTPDINSYRWVVLPSTGVVTGNANGPTFDIRFTQTGTYQILAYGISYCSESSNPTHIFTYYVSSAGYSSPAPITVTTYPNPASTLLNIEIEEVNVPANNMQIAATTNNEAHDKKFTIHLYDEHGKQVHHITVKKSRKAHFNVSHLRNGVYYLSIHDELTGKTEKQKIVVKH